MPLVPRLFPGDVELGKRDDDHKPGGKSQLGLAWQHRRIPNTPLKRSMKKVALGVLALIALYYFFRNMPTDLETPRKRPNYVHAAGPLTPLSKEPDSQATAPKGGQTNATDVPLHDYNGPIKFYNLASTLHDVLGTKGYQQDNSNVLFAAASLKSAAILLPIACEMAIRQRNYVHFALLGRDDISMDILKSVNGISQECNIFFHGMSVTICVGEMALTRARCPPGFLRPKLRLSHGSQYSSCFQPHQHIRPPAGYNR
jgi:hypothetical protein